MSWNFEHVAAGCGTVEFRRAPAVMTAERAKYWALIAISFVSGALDTE